MNFSSEEILSMLREGKSFDEIASAMTEVLNTANKTYEAEKKAKEEKLKAETEAAISDLGLILDEISDWIDLYLEGGYNPLKDLTDEEVYDAILDYQKIYSNLSSFFSTTKNGITKTYENNKGKVKKTVKSADEVIDEFLKAFNL